MVTAAAGDRQFFLRARQSHARQRRSGHGDQRRDFHRKVDLTGYRIRNI